MDARGLRGPHAATCATLDEARKAMRGCTHVIHLAAIVGGIANFHKLPHTLTEVNNALYNAVFRAALDEDVERFTYVSSSRWSSRTPTQYPTREDYLPRLPGADARPTASRSSPARSTAAPRTTSTACRTRSAARSTPTGRARCPRTSRASPTPCPDLIRKSLQRLKPLPIFGTGEHTRTLTHVDDIADGIVDRDRPSPAGLNEDFNISAADELTVAEIARICWAAVRQRPGRARVRAPAELRGRRRAPLAVGREGRAAARLEGADRRRGGHRGRPSRGCANERRRWLMPSALITGITGQDGSYLAELLLEKGYEVHGMVRRASTEKFDRIEHLRDRITLHQADLLDQRSLVDALRAAKPDEVYNLAAMSFVAVSWIQPTLTAEFTGVGVTRMLEAVREVVPGGALLPGVLERDVRQGARDAADRDDAVLPALAVRRGEGLRPPHHGQLPRVLRPVRDAPGSSSTTSRQRRGLEFVTRKITWHAAAIKLGQRDELRARQPRRRARLGLREGLRRGDVADAPARRARRLRDRHGRDEHRAALRRDRVRRGRARLGAATSSIDDAFKRPAEVDLLVGDPTQGQARARLGADDELRGADPPDGPLRPRSCCRSRLVG